MVWHRGFGRLQTQCFRCFAHHGGAPPFIAHAPADTDSGRQGGGRDQGYKGRVVCCKGLELSSLNVDYSDGSRRQVVLTTTVHQGPLFWSLCLCSIDAWGSAGNPASVFILTDGTAASQLSIPAKTSDT